MLESQTQMLSLPTESKLKPKHKHALYFKCVLFIETKTENSRILTTERLGRFQKENVLEDHEKPVSPLLYKIRVIKSTL